MKKTILLLSLLLIANVIVGQPSNRWKKINVPTEENLLKVIFYQNEAYVFSTKHVYRSSCLEDWEEIPLPATYNPTPSIFKEDLYLNGADGIYVLRNNIWTKAMDLMAASITSNTERLYIFTPPENSPYYCYYTEDGENITGLPALNDKLHDDDLYGPFLSFSKCMGDTIIVSGLASLGPVPYSLRSFDAGLRWTKDENEYSGYTSDVDYDYSTGYFVETQISWAPFFIFHSNAFPEIMMFGGGFKTTRIFKNNSWEAGATSTNSGIIMSQDNIGNIFYTPERINALGCNQKYLLAAGDSGALYLLDEEEEVYGIDELQNKESLQIYPNPAFSFQELNVGKDIEVFDLNGRASKGTEPGMYFLRDKEGRIGKVIIQ